MLALAIYISPLAHAETATPLSDGQVSLVRVNCVATHATLERIHASDALARVNLGREYETISTKLMAPMNSRIALNSLNASEVARTTADFNSELQEFRATYQRYEQTVNQLLQHDCSKDPSGFYKAIQQARIYRAQVREIVTSMSGLTTQYRTQLETVKQQAVKKYSTSGDLR